MGFKGLIRDALMLYVGLQLVWGNANNIFLGSILIVSAVFFTIIGFLRMWGYV